MQMDFVMKQKGKKMTRAKAIEILSCRDNRGLPITWQDGFVDAVDTAIEALQEQKTAEAVVIQQGIDTGIFACSECGCEYMNWEIDKGECNYCMNCGAKWDWEDEE